MSKGKIIFCWLLVLLGMVPACATTPVVSVTEAANGNKIEVPAGKVFEVRLKAMLTTGYSWTLVSKNKELEMVGKPVVITATAEKDEAADKKGNKDSKTDKNGDIKLGADADTQVFLFKAVAVGETTLNFDYVQPWDKKAGAKKKYSLIVVVK
ncbi:MAG: protease inhibitor I42 family protein [bacterium]|nr:protease inhibitor I42 family protein [bacterium]